MTGFSVPATLKRLETTTFRLEHGRSVGSQRRLKKLRWFLGDELFGRTALTMKFFWSVNNTNAAFKQRFGYTFNRNPHQDFCSQTNLELIERIRPKAVFAESRPLLNRYVREFGLTPVATHFGPDDAPLVEERRFEVGTPFHCFDNLSARRGHEKARSPRTLSPQ